MPLAANRQVHQRKNGSFAPFRERESALMTTNETSMTAIPAHCRASSRSLQSAAMETIGSVTPPNSAAIIVKA